MRIRFRRLAVAVLCLAAIPPGPLHAEIGALDNVPAATLLFPYFEVDLNDPEGINTVLSWRNASASAALTHVTIWSDLGVPVLNFDVYLTGYDVASLDLGVVLDEGRLPVTADAAQDPNDTISPQGMFSQDGSFPGCNGTLPFADPALNAAQQARLRALLTGQENPQDPGQCAGVNYGDNVARGYVTVDVVVACSLLFPTAPGYFVSGGNGVASNDNMLSGEYLMFDPATGQMHSAAAASLEASGTDPLTITPGNYTFYARSSGFLAEDNREPLATSWAVDAQAARTEMIIWRDPKNLVSNNKFNCGTFPNPFPLSQNQFVVFDRKEAPFIPGGGSFTLLPGPFAAQRVALGGPSFPAPLKPGWVYLNLNTSTGSPVDPFAQAYISVLQFPELGQDGAAADAINLIPPAAPPT